MIDGLLDAVGIHAAVLRGEGGDGFGLDDRIALLLHLDGGLQTGDVLGFHGGGFLGLGDPVPDGLGRGGVLLLRVGLGVLPGLDDLGLVDDLAVLVLDDGGLRGIRLGSIVDLLIDRLGIHRGLAFGSRLGVLGLADGVAVAVLGVGGTLLDLLDDRTVLILDHLGALETLRSSVLVLDNNN